MSGSYLFGRQALLIGQVKLTHPPSLLNTNQGTELCCVFVALSVILEFAALNWLWTDYTCEHHGDWNLNPEPEAQVGMLIKGNSAVWDSEAMHCNSQFRVYIKNIGFNRRSQWRDINPETYYFTLQRQ